MSYSHQVSHDHYYLRHFRIYQLLPTYNFNSYKKCKKKTILKSIKRMLFNDKRYHVQHIKPSYHLSVFSFLKFYLSESEHIF